MKASKILSVLLIVAMCMSMMAVTAFATGPIVTVGTAPANGEAANVTDDSQKDSGSDGSSAAVVVTDGAPVTPTAAPVETPAATPAPADEDASGNNGAIVFYAADNAGAEEDGEDEDATTDAPAADTIAMIGKTEYKSLADAVSGAVDGDKVKLVKPVTLNTTLNISKNITLNLGGNTLTFAPSQDQDAAINVSGTVTVKNGSIDVKTFDAGKDGLGGFAAAILSSGALTLDADLDYAEPTDGGEMLAVADKGSIAVIGGEYSADPSAFVDGEDYQIDDADGKFTVAEKQPLMLTANNGNVDVVTKAAKIGTDEYNTIADAVNSIQEDATGADATITLLKATTENLPGTKNITYDLGTFTLTGSVTVEAGKEVTVKNGSVTGDVANSGKLNLEAVEIGGNIHLTDGSTLNVAGDAVKAKNIDTAGTVTVNIAGGTFGTLTKGSGSTVTGNVTGGTFTAIPAEFLAANYEAVESNGAFTVQAKPATATVKNADGSVTYNADDDNKNDYVAYAKQGQNSDMVFTVDSELKSLSVNGGNDITDGYTYADGKVTIAASATFLANLKAGKNLINFKFENGAQVNVLLYVIGHVEMASNRYVLQSNTGLTATVSDTPSAITCGKSDNGTGHATLASGDYSVNGSTVTLSSAYLNKLEAGNWYVGFWNDEAVVMYPIVIAPAPSVTATDDNKDAKWYYGDGVLKFDVSPDVKGVAVDNGGTIDAKNYSVNADNILTLKAAYLKTLKYGEHTLTVVTSDGNASVKFTTAPSVVAKNGSNHTKGGSKDLVFTSSDAVTEVYVGKTKLDSKNYTISSDGKTVTLKAAFLNTLKADTTYTLTVNGSAGAAATTFKILSPGSAASKPKTGDEGNVALWAAVLVLSGAAAAALMPRKKKQ